MSALVGRLGYEKIDKDARLIQNIASSTIPNPWGKQEQKFDVRDWNSLSTIQQDILMDQMLGSTAAYAKVWVYNYCVRKISQTAARIFNYAYLENVKSGDRVEDNPIFNILTNRCNEIYDGQEQIEALISFYIMVGDSYEHVIGNTNLLIEIWPLLANNVTPEAGDGNKGEPMIKWYKEETSTKPIKHLPEEIIHCKTFNPDSHIIGIPWLKAAAAKIETLVDAEEFNASILKNGIFPAINYHTDQNQTREQVKEIKRQLVEQSGPANAGGTILTHSGFKASSIAFSPEEMQILENERYIASVIATSMGVPPEILGTITDKKTYLNSKEAYADFINTTVLPVLEKINKKRNFYFWPEGDFKIKFDENMIDAFIQAAADLNTAWWLTGNEKRRKQGIATTKDPMMDIILVPSSMIALEDLGEKEDEENL